MGVAMHVGVDRIVVGAVDRSALVAPSLAMNTLALDTPSALTAGWQFKRGVTRWRSKSVGMTSSGWLVVAQMAVVAAVVVVVAIDSVGKAPMLLTAAAVGFRIVVSYNLVLVILPMVVLGLVVVVRLHLANDSSFILDVVGWFAIAADLFLSEASVVAFVAKSDSRLHRAPK